MRTWTTLKKFFCRCRSTKIPKENNYAFIDSQNLNLSIRKMGWELDYGKFRHYLEEKYHISRAYMFIGFIAANQKLYDRLENAGFILIFKTVSVDAHGKIKGNVDADLVLKAALEINDYDKAVVVSSDGDFCSLVECLVEREKLRAVLSPDEKHCSHLLRKAAYRNIWFMNNLRHKLEYIKQKGTA